MRRHDERAVGNGRLCRILRLAGCQRFDAEASAPAALTLPEMILATIVRARFRLPRRVTAELLGVVIGTIAKAERQIRPLLDQRRYVIQPAGTDIKTLAELTDFAAAHSITLTPGTKAAR